MIPVNYPHDGHKKDTAASKLKLSPILKPNPPDDAALVEYIEYYEAGDLIFVKYDDYFWPGQVKNVL
jgi:hypothetical protein